MSFFTGLFGGGKSKSQQKVPDAQRSPPLPAITDNMQSTLAPSAAAAVSTAIFQQPVQPLATVQAPPAEQSVLPLPEIQQVPPSEPAKQVEDAPLIIQSPAPSSSSSTPAPGTLDHTQGSDTEDAAKKGRDNHHKPTPKHDKADAKSTGKEPPSSAGAGKRTKSADSKRDHKDDKHTPQDKSKKPADGSPEKHTKTHDTAAKKNDKSDATDKKTPPATKRPQSKSENKSTAGTAKPTSATSDVKAAGLKATRPISAAAKSKQAATEFAIRNDVAAIKARTTLIHFIRSVGIKKKYVEKKGEAEFSRAVFMRLVDSSKNVDMLCRALSASIQGKEKSEELATNSLKSLSAIITKDDVTAVQIEQLSTDVLVKCIKAFAKNADLVVTFVDFVCDVAKVDLPTEDNASKDGKDSKNTKDATDVKDIPKSEVTVAKESFITKFGDSGGCEVILALADKNVKSGSFVYKSFRCVFRLCQNNQFNRIRVGSPNGCTLLCKCINRYAKVVAVFEVVIRTVFVLSDFPGCQTELGKASVPDALMEGLKYMHTNKNEKFLSLIFKTIIAVAGKNHRENQLLFAKSEKFPIFSEIFSEYTSSTSVVEGASWAIITICLDNFEAAEAVCRSGFLKSLTEVLHKATNQSKMFCLWLLATIAFVDPEMEAEYEKLREILSAIEADTNPSVDEIRSQARIAKLRIGRPRVFTAPDTSKSKT
jgi:hypothetical protein